MIRFDIPGREPFAIDNIVFDYNGTIAVDGVLMEEVKPLVMELSKFVKMYVLTADTYGTVKKECEGLPFKVRAFPQERAAERKAEIVKSLSGGTACIGNGFNDIAMFDVASLSIAVINKEGMCTKLLPHADVFVLNIEDGLELFLHKDRLRADLRN